MPRKVFPLKPYPIVNPDGFNPATILPEHLRDSEDEARYFVHLLRSTKGRNKKGPDDYQELWSIGLKNIMGNAYKDVKDALVDAGIIVENPSYQKGSGSKKGFSKSYNFADTWNAKTFQQTFLTNNTILRRLKRWRDKDRKTLSLPVHFHLERYLRQIEIDVPGALAWADSDENQPSRSTGSQDYRQETKRQIFALANGHFKFKRDAFNRLHHNLTNLKIGLRQFLTYRGETLAILDVASCQPLLIGLLCVAFTSNNGFLPSFRAMVQPDWRENLEYDFPSEVLLNIDYYLNNGQSGLTNVYISLNSTNPPLPPSPLCFTNCTCLPNDLKRYLTLCQRGTLYKYLSRKMDQDEDRMKKRLFKTVFYKRLGHQYKEDRRFKTLFPTVWDVTQRLKRKDYRHLSHLAQRLEAEIIISRTCTRLMDECPDTFILPIHGALVTTSGDADRIKAILVQEFQRFGLTTKVRRKELTP